jgi:prepilin-type processing-associated H-X9-DG protein
LRHIYNGSSKNMNYSFLDGNNFLFIVCDTDPYLKFIFGYLMTPVILIL